MDLKDLFTFKKTSHSLFILVILNILIPITLSIDPRYEACESRSCGSLRNISYPFRLDSQESYCGYPGFNVSCYEGYPNLKISDDDYVILDMSYANSWINVSNAVVYEDLCTAPMNNFSTDSYNSSQVDFFYLHYNCTQKPKDHTIYPLGCPTNTSLGLFNFAVYHEDILDETYDSVELCERVVKAAVDKESLGNLTGINIAQLLKKGFLLTWNGTSNCTDCVTTGGRCGFENEFICFCLDGSSSNDCSSFSLSSVRGKKMNWQSIIIIAVSATFLGMCLICLVFFIHRRRKKHHYATSSLLSRDLSSYPSSFMDSVKGGNYKGVQIFTYAELEEATNNFDSAKELGDGGFGTVYHGKLRDGRCVAVKRLYENNFRRVEQFMNEVEILTRLRHHNLVSLYGCTSRHSRELLLVYEYVPNGTVADHLHGSCSKSGSLTLPIRISIAMETASALSYLHASDIIHRDVKTNNILLDNNYSVKVADFGLSRLFPTNVTHISTAPQGTPGYVDPEYHQCYQLTSKSDVYSFGVVLIELISSMPAVDITRHRHEINLSNMALAKIQNHALHEIVDLTLGFNTDKKATRVIQGVAELAFRCLQGEKEMRPTMEEVMRDLSHVQNDACDIVESVEVEFPKDDVMLLKGKPLILSPNSVNAKWDSTFTTPNTSG